MKFPNFAGFDKIKDKLKIIFITGDTGSGKTRKAYNLLEQLKNSLPIYVFKHKHQERIEKLGFKNMYDIDEMENLNDAVVWIDEPQIIFPKYERRGSVVLNRILSLSRQKDIILIISTSDTRYITASEEFYISTYMLGKIDYKMIKRGSKVRQILNEMATITPQGYADNIKEDELLFYNRATPELNRKYKFKTPEYFDEELSKPFK